MNEGFYLLLEFGKKMGNGLKLGSIYIGVVSLYFNNVSIELV